MVTAYLLTGTAVTPLYGKLSDIHGRRVTMLIAIVLFALGSLACGHRSRPIRALYSISSIVICHRFGLLVRSSTIA